MSEDAPFPTADPADAAEQARPVSDDAGGAAGDDGPLGDVDAAEADALEQRTDASEDDEDGYRA